MYPRAKADINHPPRAALLQTPISTQPPTLLLPSHPPTMDALRSTLQPVTRALPAPIRDTGLSREL